MPAVSAVSFLEPASTKTPMAETWSNVSSVATRTPLASVVRRVVGLLKAVSLWRAGTPGRGIFKDGPFSSLGLIVWPNLLSIADVVHLHWPKRGSGLEARKRGGKSGKRRI